MPFPKWTVEPVFLVRNALPPDKSEPGNFYPFVQASLVNCIKQLSSLAQIANHIFEEIAVECRIVHQRTTTLREKIGACQEVVDNLNARAVKVPVSSADEVRRQMRLQTPYAAKTELSTQLFNASTRPACVERLYAKAAETPIAVLSTLDRHRTDGLSCQDLFLVTPVIGRRKGKSKKLLDIETRKPANFSLAPSKQDSCEYDSASLPRLVPPSRGFYLKQNENHELERLPSPEEQSMLSSLQYPSTVVPIDTSGATFSRMSLFRRSLIHVDFVIKRRKNKSRRSKRRHTICEGETSVNMTHTSCQTDFPDVTSGRSSLTTRRRSRSVQESALRRRGSQDYSTATEEDKTPTKGSDSKRRSALSSLLEAVKLRAPSRKAGTEDGGRSSSGNWSASSSTSEPPPPPSTSSHDRSRDDILPIQSLTSSPTKVTRRHLWDRNNNNNDCSPSSVRTRKCVAHSDDGDSSVYSVDTDGYYTSMHTDSGLWRADDLVMSDLIQRGRKASQSSVDSSINSFLSKCSSGSETSPPQKVKRTLPDPSDSEQEERLREKTTILRYPSLCAVSPETSDDEFADFKRRTIIPNVNIVVAEVHQQSGLKSEEESTLNKTSSSPVDKSEGVSQPAPSPILSRSHYTSNKSHVHEKTDTCNGVVKVASCLSYRNNIANNLQRSEKTDEKRPNIYKNYSPREIKTDVKPESVCKTSMSSLPSDIHRTNSENTDIVIESVPNDASDNNLRNFSKLYLSDTNKFNQVSGRSSDTFVSPKINVRSLSTNGLPVKTSTCHRVQSENIEDTMYRVSDIEEVEYLSGPINGFLKSKNGDIRPTVPINMYRSETPVPSSFSSSIFHDPLGTSTPRSGSHVTTFASDLDNGSPGCYNSKSHQTEKTSPLIPLKYAQKIVVTPIARSCEPGLNTTDENSNTVLPSKKENGSPSYISFQAPDSPVSSIASFKLGETDVRISSPTGSLNQTSPLIKINNSDDSVVPSSQVRVITPTSSLNRPVTSSQDRIISPPDYTHARITPTSSLTRSHMKISSVHQTLSGSLISTPNSHLRASNTSGSLTRPMARIITADARTPSPTNSLNRPVARVTLDPAGKVVYSSNSLERPVNRSCNDSYQSPLTIAKSNNTNPQPPNVGSDRTELQNGVGTFKPLQPEPSENMSGASPNQNFSSFRPTRDFTFRPSRGGRFCRSYFPSHLLSPKDTSPNGHTAGQNVQQTNHNLPSNSSPVPKVDFNPNSNIWPKRLYSSSKDEPDIGNRQSLSPPDLIPSGESPPSTLDITSPAVSHKRFSPMDDNSSESSRSLKSLSSNDLFALIHSSKKRHNIRTESEKSLSPMSSRSVSPALSLKLQPIETGSLQRRCDTPIGKKPASRVSPAKPTSLRDFKMLLLQASRTTGADVNQRPSAAQLLRVASRTPPPLKVPSPVGNKRCRNKAPFLTPAYPPILEEEHEQPKATSTWV